MEGVGLFYGHLIYFTVFCYILRTFGIARGNLVYLFPFWYFVPRKIWQQCGGTPLNRLHRIRGFPKNDISTNDLLEYIGPDFAKCRAVWGQYYDHYFRRFWPIFADFDNFWRCWPIFGDFDQFSAISTNFRRFRPIFDEFDQFSTIRPISGFYNSFLNTKHTFLNTNVINNFKSNFCDNSLSILTMTDDF
jgi:hypothetical protein